MALEYKGIDSVSGRKRFYDPQTNEYSLGDLATETETMSEGSASRDTSFSSEDSSNSPSQQVSESSTPLAPAPADKPNVVEIKTDKESASQIETNPETGVIQNQFTGKDKDKYAAATEKNILHNYRSWTYNFAIGALTPEAIGNHRYLARDIKAYPVLNSAGKGTSGVGISSQGINSTRSDYQQSKALVDGFNKESPGRFDMFIDNVSVDSIIGAGSEKSGSSIATNITFDVYEPYSMNGFIEALQVAGRAAGYSDYMNAAFALRVQFQGYPDTATNAQMKPEVVPMSTRYFPIKITEVEVDVNESGTRYRVNSVPYNQMGFGAPTNSLTSDIKIEGNTIGEVLKNFFDAINRMVEDRVKNENTQAGRDFYEISCPKLVSEGSPQNTKAAILNGTTSTSYTSDIIKSKMNDELTSLNVFKFADPANYPGAVAAGTTSTTATSNPSTGKINPKNGTVVFQSGAQIHDCIAAIVRDSTYTRDLLKPENLDKVKKGNGLVTYFTVRMETEIKGEDKVNNKRFHTYRYVLEPYQMHYTRIPGQEKGVIDLKDIKGTIKREYNYVYTGKNVDVLKFALKFDSLYYSAIPAMLGNRPSTNPQAQQSGPGGIVDFKNEVSQAVIDQKSTPPSSAPLAQTMVDPMQNSFHQQAKAGQVQSDPYALMAQNLHSTVLNSVDLISGNLDILGDPYWLVTGGMGNNNLELKEPMLTTDGQAPTTQGDVFVNINFRNPVDINSKTGLVDFGSNPLSFSGVYRVVSLKNNFKDGMFSQSLEIIRVPGQIIGENKKEILPPSGKTSPRIGQQLVKDTALSTILRSGIRPSDFNLANLLSRGLPSSGLPGNLSNYTNSLINSVTGGASSVGGLLNQVAGATTVASNLTNQLGVSPVSGVNALTSGVRLAASGLSQISQVPNTLAATVTAAGNAVGSLANIPNAAVKLADNVATSIANLPSTALSAASQVGSNIASNVTGLTQSVTSMAKQTVGAVSGMVGDATNMVAGLQNTIPTDINAIGSKLGIDTSALAGLSPELASKMTNQLVEVAKKVPANTDLASLQEQGVSFASITQDKLPNLPAIQPKTVAPLPISDPGISDIAAKFGNIGPLLSGNISLPPLTDINKVLNPLGSISAGLTSGVGSITAGIQSTIGSAQSVVGAVGNANSLVNNAIGSAAGIANNVGTLAQNAVQGLSPASIGLGSVESNYLNVAGLTQNVSSQVSKLGISLSNQYGSLQSSPLTKLIQTNNIQGII